MNLKAVIATTAILGVFSGAANAELVESDYMTTGDNLAFTDTRTNTTFLDLSVTLGKSIEEVSAQLITGGSYDGWYLATPEQIDELFFSITGTYAEGSKTTLRYTDVNAFRSVSIDTDTTTVAYGIYENHNGNVHMMGSTTYRSTSYNNYVRSESLDWSEITHGVFLVKSDAQLSDVPVPFMGFAGLGLLALGLRRKSV